MEFIYFVNEVQLRLCSLLSCNHEQEEDSKYVDFSSLVTVIDSGEGLISTRHQHQAPDHYVSQLHQKCSPCRMSFQMQLSLL